MDKILGQKFTNPNNGRIYYYSGSGIDYNGAVKLCSSFGYQILQVESVQRSSHERDWIYSAINPGGHWLGVTKGTNPTYWADGTKIAWYQSWNPSYKPQTSIAHTCVGQHLKYWYSKILLKHLNSLQYFLDLLSHILLF